MPTHDRTIAGPAWARRHQINDVVPVPVRPHAVAGALHHQHRPGAGAQRRKKSRGHNARFFRRLSGDTGGNQSRECPDVYALRWREFCRHSLSQRQRSGHADAVAARHARAQRLGMMLRDGSLVSWVWFSLALILFAIEAVRPGRFALWLGFAAVMVGVIASVARWAWPLEVLPLVALAA